MLARHYEEALQRVLMQNEPDVFEVVLPRQVQRVLVVLQVRENQTIIAADDCFVLVLIEADEVRLRIEALNLYTT